MAESSLRFTCEDFGQHSIRQVFFHFLEKETLIVLVISADIGTHVSFFTLCWFLSGVMTSDKVSETRLTSLFPRTITPLGRFNIFTE